MTGRIGSEQGFPERRSWLETFTTWHLTACPGGVFGSCRLSESVV
jgi:hypothetical protein